MAHLMHGKETTIDGIRIYYEENSLPRTAQHTIVLLHGFLSSSFSFRMLVPFLADQFHLVSVDLPPFGLSDKAKTYHYSYRNIASTVLQLLDQVGIRSFSIVGHSMGGQIALNMMLLSPDNIQKGILLSSSSYYTRAKKLHILASYLPFFPYFVKRYLGKTGVIGNLKSVVYDQSLIDQSMINGYAEQFADPKIFAALAHLLRDREGDLSESALRSIHTPCLLIWGDQDQIVPMAVGKRLSRDLPNSHLVTLQNTGHLIPEEKPREVAEQIRVFLN